MNEPLRTDPTNIANAPVPQAGLDDRLVSAAELLRVMWSDKSRPSLRWLREQQARRTIPHIKIGGRVWFRPSQVDKWLDEWQEGRPKLQR